MNIVHAPEQRHHDFGAGQFSAEYGEQVDELGILFEREFIMRARTRAVHEVHVFPTLDAPEVITHRITPRELDSSTPDMREFAASRAEASHLRRGEYAALRIQRILSGPLADTIRDWGFEYTEFYDDETFQRGRQFSYPTLPALSELMQSRYGLKRENGNLVFDFVHPQNNRDDNLSGKQIIDGLADGTMFVSSQHDHFFHLFGMALMAQSPTLAGYIKSHAERELQAGHDWDNLPDSTEESSAVNLLAAWDGLTGFTTEGLCYPNSEAPHWVIEGNVDTFIEDLEGHDDMPVADMLSPRAAANLVDVIASEIRSGIEHMQRLS